MEMDFGPLLSTLDGIAPLPPAAAVRIMKDMIDVVSRSPDRFMKDLCMLRELGSKNRGGPALSYTEF
ncbi:hypothetical protein VB716_07740 [Synechococcus sp. CCY9201]|uniref:hypothetical protein n=1 Tax=Synechococcus sp. CCY9201 TaxID=174697 RepID=UPI002B2090BA|nr:hypothetical protein [Synechococcus sp. CCY9201]MEA5474113.1 hypothetical protein [Synechococcus sp. CCY9201]